MKKVIGVAGASASGKTYLVKKLAEKIPNTVIHSMDNYYKKKEFQPKDKNGVENYDDLNSLNIQQFQKDLKSLMNGETLHVKEYNYNNKKKEETYLTLKGDIVLVEGLFVLHLGEIKDWLDTKIFVETDEPTILKRRVTRDAIERGYDLHDVLYRYEHHVSPTFHKIILPSRNYADLIIQSKNNMDKAIEILIRYLT